jgi:hypothetical protein
MDGYMEGFQAWAKVQGLSDSTFWVYRSLVRGFLHDSERVGHLLYIPGLLEKEALLHEATLLSGSRSMFRAALRGFVRFAAEKEGLDLAQLTIAFPDRRQARWLGTVAHPAGDAIRKMVYHMGTIWTPKLIERRHWSDCTRAWRKGVEVVEIRDYLKSICGSAPLDTVREVALWAGGGKPPAPELPLIPAEPLSKMPMPATRLRRLLKVKTGNYPEADP